MNDASAYWRTASDETAVAVAIEPMPVTDTGGCPQQVHRRRRLRGALIAGGTQQMRTRLAVLGGGLLTAAGIALVLVGDGSQETSLRDAAADRDPPEVVDQRVADDVQARRASPAGKDHRQGARRTTRGEKREPTPDTDEPSGQGGPTPIPESQRAPPQAPAPAPPAPTEPATVEPTPAEPVPAETSPTSDFSFGSPESAPTR